MQVPDNYVAIPLQTNKVGLLDVSISLNDRPGRFHLDTGASQSCLDRERAIEYALQETDVDYEAAGLGGAQRVSKVTIESFAVERHVLGHYDLHVIDLSHVNAAAIQLGAEPIDGVLGNDFLREYQAIIDYGTESLYLKLNCAEPDND